MKYLRQFFVIMVVSFLGEVCHTLLPWPIPASIYGMAILFSALQAGLLRLEQVQDVSDFLCSILPILFVAPAVNLLDCWQEVAPFAFQIVAVIVISTIVVFGISGKVTQWIVDRKDGARHE